MEESIDTSTSVQTLRPATSLPIAWLIASLVATVALSLAAAHAPQRIRLLGLFSIVFGLVIGWVLNRLAETLETRLSRRAISVVAMVLTTCGIVGSTWEIVRIELLNQVTSPKDVVAQRLIEQMDLPNSAQESSHSEPSVRAEFRKHLSRRLRQLGSWPNPWPEIFWLGELFAGAAASVWISSRGPSIGSSATLDQ